MSETGGNSESKDSHGALTDDNHAALWSGRFSEGPDSDAVGFETSIDVDSRMAEDDIEGSIAHAKMLGKTGIISPEESRTIVGALEKIGADIKSGALKIDRSAEDIHSFVEAVLTDRIGETGKRVHTGRSRNDQIALDERLYLRRAVPALQARIAHLIETLCGIADKNTETLLSGYTHMQRAQPGTLAQHLLAWAFMLKRDWERFDDALKRISKCPLGSGALEGSTLPLDREYTARFLGFDGVTENTIDSVSDRDYVAETVADAAILQSHLSRMCEDIVIWSSREFSFVNLSEKWSTGSSMMPQKKNPDFAELIRGRTGRVYGDLMSLLTVLKGIPLAYDRDLQEDKSSLFDALDTVSANVSVFDKMISSAEWNVSAMAASCEGGFSNATDLAEYLVKRGVPFREAHSIAARIVRRAMSESRSRIEDLPIEELKEECPLIESDVYDCLSARSCVENRRVTGGPSKESCEYQIKVLRAFCESAIKTPASL